MTVVINGRFLLNSFGGARRFAIELTERLARLRGDVLLVTPVLPSSVILPDVPHRSVGRFRGPIWEQVELPLWLRTNGRPLLLNPATIAPFSYRRQISVVHDVAPAIRPQDFTPLFRAQWHLAVRLGMLRDGQRLVTISEESRGEISRYFHVDRERIDLVYAGADSLASEGQADDSLSQSPSFLAFGRHGAAKNVRTVIDAAGRLPEDSPITVRFVGQLDPALEPYAEESKVPRARIEWRGRVTDEELAHEYRKSIGFIWPSLHEGFGIPPLEAQSMGIPVIASDIPINREVLGDSALYFSATEPVELAAALERLVADAELRARLQVQGVENARRFTWNNTALGWDRLIRESGL